MKLSLFLENLLLELNETRKLTIQGNYELSSDDKEKVNHAVVNFKLSLIEKNVKPKVNGKKIKTQYSYDSGITTYLNKNIGS